MTPEEALEKVCPLRNYEIGPPGKCLGPECMLWQWSVTPKGAAKHGGAEDGYCGLGRP